MVSKQIVSFEEFMEQVRSYITVPEDLKRIEEAYEEAKTLHQNQKRKSGEPYINHVLWVAFFLSELETSPNTIIAGLLHDVIEDCEVSKEDLAKQYGEDVANLVEGVTKVKRLEQNVSEQLAETHRKIYISMAKDIRVIVIKLADRLHNMRTLDYMSPEKQKRIAKETLNVYAPIAHRLGINDIKTELEDLSLSYLCPDEYLEITQMIESSKLKREEAVDLMIEAIGHLMKLENIPCKITGRAKSIYSIYKKVFEKHRPFSEIYDLYAIRVITETKLNCYEVLGIIHDHYRPIPGRFKDYIAMPKPNMYQSLHTAVVGELGNIFEVQIRTFEMDAVAERGIAAHFKYKEGKSLSPKQEQKQIEDKLQWFREFVSVSGEQTDTSDSKEFFETLKHDIFDANVYVLTPAGKIVELPSGSTPVDFAYRIHTEVGNSTVGAIVNGVMVPLSTQLHTGDVVEMKTSKKHQEPSEDWLKFVKTANAKSKIRSSVQKRLNENREERIEAGRHLLKEEINKRGLDEKLYLSAKPYDTYFGVLTVKDFDGLLFSIGSKALTVHHIFEVIQIERKPVSEIDKIIDRKATNAQMHPDGINVEGLSGLKVSLSKCCSPIPGDDIIGYISKGEGVKVHRVDCPNVNSEASLKRLISVSWDKRALMNHQFECEVMILADDRPMLLSDIASTLGQMKISIRNLDVKVKDASAMFHLTVMINNAESIKLMTANLMKVSNIYEVKRVIN